MLLYMAAICSTTKVWSVTDFPGLKPACSSEKMLFVVACSCSFWCHFLSIILSHVLVSDIGLYFEGS
jgi:hypothetical protein